jgi:hypothetical protein
MAQAAIIQEAPTRMQGTSLVLPPGHWRAFSGAPVPFHRKRIIITNEDPNTRVYIVAGPDQSQNPDNTVEKFLTLKVNSDPFSLDTNATIVIKNLSATETVSTVQVLELFYATF